MKMMAYALDVDLAKQDELGQWDWMRMTKNYTLNEEVIEWVENNIPKRYWKGQRYRGQQPYCFRVDYTQVRQVELIFWDEADLVLFKMRWW